MSQVLLSGTSLFFFFSFFFPLISGCIAELYNFWKLRLEVLFCLLFPSFMWSARAQWAKAKLCCNLLPDLHCAAIVAISFSDCSCPCIGRTQKLVVWVPTGLRNNELLHGPNRGIATELGFWSAIWSLNVFFFFFACSPNSDDGWFHVVVLEDQGSCATSLSHFEGSVVGIGVWFYLSFYMFPHTRTSSSRVYLQVTISWLE